MPKKRKEEKFLIGRFKETEFIKRNGEPLTKKELKHNANVMFKREDRIKYFRNNEK